MKATLRLLNISIISILFFSSCTVEKRKYVSGYNVEWKNSTPASQRNVPAPNSKFGRSEIISAGQPTADCIVYDETATTLADNSKSIHYSDALGRKLNKHAIVLSEECDVILLKNGNEMKVKVSGISQDEIKYKKCEDINGEIFTLKKSEVFMIKYSNGTKDVIAQDTHAADKKKDKHKGWVTGLILGIIGTIALLLILGMVLSNSRWNL